MLMTNLKLNIAIAAFLAVSCYGASDKIFADAITTKTYKSDIIKQTSTSSINNNMQDNSKMVKPSLQQWQLMREMNIHQDACSHLENRIVALTVPYYGMDSKEHSDGLIFVLDTLAPSVQNMFKELLVQKFMIGGIDPFKGVQKIGGNFVPDSDYNYTGCYSCRVSASDKYKISVHSLGAAIDLNPLYNPFVNINLETKSIDGIVPVDGIKHLNRESIRPGKDSRYGIINQKVIDIFAYHGFVIWGGYWDYPLDYMHFQIPKNLAQLLVAMQPVDAAKMYGYHLKFSRAMGGYRDSLVKKDLSTCINCDIAITLVDLLLDAEKNYAKKDMVVEELIELYRGNRESFWQMVEKMIKNYPVIEQKG